MRHLLMALPAIPVTAKSTRFKASKSSVCTASFTWGFNIDAVEAITLKGVMALLELDSIPEILMKLPARPAGFVNDHLLAAVAKHTRGNRVLIEMMVAAAALEAGSRGGGSPKDFREGHGRMVHFSELKV